MFGSIFYNFWAAIIAFSVYFFATLSDTNLPSQILMGSGIAAIIAFLCMFALRYLIAFVLYTPEEQLFDELNQENEQLRMQSSTEQSLERKHSEIDISTIEFNDESTEEIAKVVRTMMNQDRL